MNTDLNPVVAVIDPAVASGWAVMPLDNILALDDGLAEEADAIRAALGVGETYAVGGGAAPYNFLVSLSHRDAPMHLPNRAIACEAYAAFCFYFGMDEEQDAHENLTECAILHETNPAASLPVNWLRTFADHFDDLEG